MSQQIISPISGTASTNNGIKINKKKRKRKFLHTSAMSSFTMHTSTTPEKHDDLHKSSQPTKKRRRNNKKKTTEEESTETIKPVLVVKNPEDYSANWKKLKEVLTFFCMFWMILHVFVDHLVQRFLTFSSIIGSIKNLLKVLDFYRKMNTNMHP